MSLGSTCFASGAYGYVHVRTYSTSLDHLQTICVFCPIRPAGPRGCGLPSLPLSPGGYHADDDERTVLQADTIGGPFFRRAPIDVHTMDVGEFFNQLEVFEEYLPRADSNSAATVTLAATGV